MSSIKPLPQSDISSVRLIQKDIVYIVGLPLSLSHKDLLMQFDYFGQYGTIVKISFNKSDHTKNKKGIMTYSAYITYETSQEAAMAILGIDNVDMDGSTIRASFGTTKYCAFFIEKRQCPNRDCLYLHSLTINEEETFTKGESRRNLFDKHHSLAMKLCGLEGIDHKEMMTLKNKHLDSSSSSPNVMTRFASIDMIYQRFFNHYTNDNGNGDGEVEEEIEYVLVRECNNNRKKKQVKKPRKMTEIQRGKYFNQQQSNSTPIMTPIKINRKLTYEEPLPINTKDGNENESNNDSSSNIPLSLKENKACTSSSLSVKSNASTIQSVSPEKHINSMFLRKMPQSRFDFASNSPNAINSPIKDQVDVPESFSNFVTRKTLLLLYISQHPQDPSHNDSLVKFANIETYDHYQYWNPSLSPQ